MPRANKRLFRVVCEHYGWDLTFKSSEIVALAMSVFDGRPKSKCTVTYLYREIESGWYGPYVDFTRARALVILEFLGNPKIKGISHMIEERHFMKRVREFILKFYPGIFSIDDGDIEYTFSNLVQFVKNEMGEVRVESDVESSEDECECECEDECEDDSGLYHNQMRFPSLEHAGGFSRLRSNPEGDERKVDPQDEFDLTRTLRRLLRGEMEREDVGQRPEDPGRPQFGQHRVPFNVTNPRDRITWKIFMAGMSSSDLMTYSRRMGWHAGRDNPIGPSNALIMGRFHWNEHDFDASRDVGEWGKGTRVDTLKPGVVDPHGIDASEFIPIGEDFDVMTNTMFKIPHSTIYETHLATEGQLMPPEYISRLIGQVSMLVETIRLSGRSFVAARLKLNGLTDDASEEFRDPTSTIDLGDEDVKHIQTLHTSSLVLLESDFREHVSKLESQYDVGWVDSILVTLMTMPNDRFNLHAVV